MATFGLKRILVNEGGIRSGWRILLFMVLFLVILMVIAPLARLGPGEGAGALLVQAVLALGAALVVSWIMLALVDHRSLGALGFAWTTATPRELGVGFAIGVVSLALVVGGFLLLGWVGYHPESGSLGSYLGSLGAGLLVFLVAAASEEAIFRGYPFQALVQGIGAVPATILASLAFAAVHSANPDVDLLALANIFLAGVLLSVAYLRTRSLWFTTAVHLGWNWSTASLFDLPVSGLMAFNTPLYEPAVTGPVWATGGAFGPEGGIGASLAFLLALVAVLRLPGIAEAPGMRALRPLIDRNLDEDGEMVR